MNKIFSGDKSKELWDKINRIDAISTGDDIRDVIYSLVVKLQELEVKFDSVERIVMDGKWCKFIEKSTTRKTKIFTVVHKDDAELILGSIEWYNHWRQYCFYPSDSSLFSNSCLNDISLFIKELMDDRKS